MTLTPLKQTIINKITKTAIEYFSAQKRTSLQPKNNLSLKSINEYIKSTKLSAEDYKIIKKEITEKLFTNEFLTQIKQINSIINIMSKNLINYKLEYTYSEPLIYFHLQNNTSYIINYDNIENKWYLALIDTESLNTIKEIHNSEFDTFIKYIKKLK